MIGLVIVGCFLAWFAIAIWMGFSVFKSTQKRWKQVVTSLFMLWLPFWDVIPGYLAYRNTVDTMGGVRIHRVVTAEGYFTGSIDDCFDCWRELKHSPYQYIEVERTKPGGRLKEFEPLPGYYEYRLIPRTSSECAPLSMHYSYFDSIGLNDLCVLSTHREQPLSRYRIEGHSWQGLKSGRRLVGLRVPEVEVTAQMVIDRETSEVIAEAHAVRYMSWIAQFLAIPGWQYSSNRSSGIRTDFELTEVIKPRN
jgi:hypothetical protein